MQSQLTVRLPNNLEKEITNLAQKLRLKRSDIAKIALEKFIAEFQKEDENKPYEKVKNLVGKVSSGVPDLGESHREHLLKKFSKNT